VPNTAGIEALNASTNTTPRTWSACRSFAVRGCPTGVLRSVSGMPST
jgi:hypothetical protein